MASPLVAVVVPMSVPTEPELFVVALPLLPVLVEIEVVTVPELFVMTFLLRSKLVSLAAVPELLQVTSVAVVVQTNCADAGEAAVRTQPHKQRERSVSACGGGRFDA